MSDLPLPVFEQALSALRHPPVFVTVSGSHLYGFPSADSDFDLRGAHLLPGEAFWGLWEPRETEEPKVETAAGLVEIVSHDLRKFARLLLKRNGYVLEQLTSPLVVRTSAVHRRLLELVPELLTRNHYYHYRGFYHNERREYERSGSATAGHQGGGHLGEGRSVKKLLYCYRVLMTGCVLLREGVCDANLPSLNGRFGLTFLDELVALKASGEGAGLADDARFAAELVRLEAELDRAYAESTLPESAPAYEEVDRLITRARREGVG